MLTESVRSKVLSGESMIEQLSSSINPDVIMRCSLDGIILEVSDTVQLTYGYDVKDLIGKSSYDFIHSDDIGEFLIPFANGEIDIATFTYRVMNASGNYIWSECTVSVLKNRANNKPMEIISISRDITSRKKTIDQLMEAENLSVLGKLAAGLAHEIRNPLTTVKGFLQLISAETILKEEYISLMQSEIERIEQITQDLMLLSKPSNYNKQALDIIKIIEDVTILLEPEAYKNKVGLQMESFKNPLHVYCNEKKIKQVFINLMKNGIESMKEGGALMINITSNDQKNKIDIAIIDQGCGITEPELEQLGQPFFTTKQTGNGLGLMMSSKIVQEHNGIIKVDSEVGVGTTFHVELPALTED